MNYDHIVILDTNIYFHFQPIQNIPWESVVGVGTVLILLIPQNMIEIDKRKRDGKLHKRARDVGAIARKIIESGENYPLSPRLHVGYASDVRVDWEGLDLDRSEGDHRMIGEAVSIPGIPNQKLQFFGHDSYPIGLAKRYGLVSRFVSDEYLLPPEPHPLERELAAAKERLAIAESSQPSFVGDVSISQLWQSQPVRVESGGVEVSQRLAERAVLKQPDSSSIFVSAINDRRYDSDELEAYNRRLPAASKRLNRRAEAILNQFSVTFTIQNDSAVMAESTLITVRSSGAALLEFPMFPFAWPPKLPRKTSVLDVSTFPFRGLPIAAAKDPYELYVDFPDSPNKEAHFTIERFMPKKILSVEFFVVTFQELGSDLSVAASISAKNFRGTKELGSEIKLEFLHLPFNRAFNIEEGVNYLPGEAMAFYKPYWKENGGLDDLVRYDEFFGPA
jgi:hypothetical protein